MGSNDLSKVSRVLSLFVTTMSSLTVTKYEITLESGSALIRFPKGYNNDSYKNGPFAGLMLTFG